MTAGEKTQRCIVAGRVQGVFFRAATAEKAGQLGLRGWAKNLPDGRVEVVAAGTPDAVAELTAWLWTGSPGARVDSVETEVFDGPVPDGFHTV